MNTWDQVVLVAGFVTLISSFGTLNMVLKWLGSLFMAISCSWSAGPWPDIPLSISL